MSKRGMRAAGVCLVTVAVMSGSVTANSAVTTSASVQELVADDFTVRFSATPTRVVLSPNGGKSAAEYRIVVTHPRRIAHIDSLTLDFISGDGRGFKNFSLRGLVVKEPTASRTVLLGQPDYDLCVRNFRKWRWGCGVGRTRPGLYTAHPGRVEVAHRGDVKYVRVEAPRGQLRVAYQSRTLLDEVVTRKDRVGLEGRLRVYNGKMGYNAKMGRDKRQWSSAAGKYLEVWFDRDGGQPPKIVTFTTTDSRGRFSVERQVHKTGRWWVRYPGGPQFASSRSTAHKVTAS